MDKLVKVGNTVYNIESVDDMLNDIFLNDPSMIVRDYAKDNFSIIAGKVIFRFSEDVVTSIPVIKDCSFFNLLRIFCDKPYYAKFRKYIDPVSMAIISIDKSQNGNNDDIFNYLAELRMYIMLGQIDTISIDYTNFYCSQLWYNSYIKDNDFTIDTLIQLKNHVLYVADGYLYSKTGYCKETFMPDILRIVDNYVDNYTKDNTIDGIPNIDINYIKSQLNALCPTVDTSKILYYIKSLMDIKFITLCDNPELRLKLYCTVMSDLFGYFDGELMPYETFYGKISKLIGLE